MTSFPWSFICGKKHIFHFLRGPCIILIIEWCPEKDVRLLSLHCTALYRLLSLHCMHCVRCVRLQLATRKAPVHFSTGRSTKKPRPHHWDQMNTERGDGHFLKRISPLSDCWIFWQATMEISKTRRDWTSPLVIFIAITWHFNVFVICFIQRVKDRGMI